MNAIIYQNTKTSLLGLNDTFHKNQSRGFAYMHNNYFIHMYGQENGLWVISTGLTVSQQVKGRIQDWVADTFGAEDIRSSKNLIGIVIKNVWRPGLYYEEVHQAFSIQQHEQQNSEQALRILMEKLNDLLLYIEPSQYGLHAYSHKTRELLILACTEIENTWQYYMEIAGIDPQKKYTTKDYIKLHSPLFLSEYQVSFQMHKDVPVIRPFNTWQMDKPTESLPWYDAYNKTKHHRNLYFDKATLLSCIEAISANLILFCVRFSPYPLFEKLTPLSSMVNQFFDISLIDTDPNSFYVPRIHFPENYPRDLAYGSAQEYVAPWETNELIL